MFVSDRPMVGKCLHGDVLKVLEGEASGYIYIFA